MSWVEERHRRVTPRGYPLAPTSGLLAATLTGFLLCCVSCAAPASDQAVGPAGDRIAVAAGPDDIEPSTVPTSRPPDPEAPLTFAPLVRGGGMPESRLAAGAGHFSKAGGVSYPDGISLTVDRFSHATERALGPGTFPGRPFTLVFLTLRNGSPLPIELNEVVVTATYGTPARIAAAVYEDARVQDFAGLVPPGASATAVYAFAIPPQSRTTATVSVDFDGSHFPAEFTGGMR